MRERLGLQWIGGQQGESRVLEAVDTVARRPSLAGYLNTIYPNKVQILGTEELSWLDSLDSRQRWGSEERRVGKGWGSVDLGGSRIIKKKKKKETRTKES